ncbi:MAG TPA: hypothetical protein VFX50_13255, partial [Gemmatimonadales bacterium]|nr:hypothetical protein [Gemmatimonadales bacterium]
MLALAAPRLEVAVTGWIALDSAGGLPFAPFPDPTRERRPFAPRRHALVTSWHGEGFHPAVVRALARDPGRLGAASDSLRRLLRAGSYRGVVLDLEGHQHADSTILRTVVSAFARAARGAGARSVTLAVPAAGGVYADPALLALPDRVLVMLYDEHWSGSAAGPVASPGWVDEALARWRRLVPSERLVAALPVYGYLWRNAAQGTLLSHAELLALEARSGRSAGRDSASGGQVLALDDGGVAWYTDVEALQRLRTVVSRYGITRVGLWRLG